MFTKFKLKHKIIVQGAGLSLFLAFGFFAAGSCASASEITSENVIKLVNDTRSSLDVPVLKESNVLDQAAKDKAWDMISHNYFAHTSPTGATPWKWFEKNGYDYKYAGENLAMDFYSAEKQNQAWMNSPSHRKNILNPVYQEIGVAVVRGIISDHVSTVTVQMFGTQDAVSVPDSEPRTEEEKVNNENEIKIFEEGKIAKSEQPIMLGTISENTKDNIVAKATLGASENKFIRMSDLTYKDSGENGMLGQSAEIGSYETVEIIIWFAMILFLSFSIAVNARMLSKYKKPIYFPISGSAVLVAIMAASMFCGIFFE